MADEQQQQHPAPPNEGHDWDQAARDTYQRLRDRATSDAPPAWMPTEEGDELFGTFVDLIPAAPTKFGPAPVVQLAQPSGEVVSVWLLHSVLRREFERAAPAIGENVLIRYLGMVQPEGGGNPYQTYSLTVDRKAAPVTWEQIAQRYDAGAETVEAATPPASARPSTEVATASAPSLCPKCGYANGLHADGCPDGIPF
jgi:hypothetical protein